MERRCLETIVLVRHGEKPDKGLGQLDCQVQTFGRPSAVFAPDPPSRGRLRSLNTDGLRAALEQPLYRNAVVIVAWEHRLIETIARALLAAHGGDPALVRKWDKDDFDSIYVVTITGTGDAAKVTFSHGREGLDGQPDACPRSRSWFAPATVQSAPWQRCRWSLLRQPLPRRA
jgi:hypothetical protein